MSVRARSVLRLLAIGGYLSYRALFQWLNPRLLIPTMVVTPVLQVLLFAGFGSYLRAESPEFYIIGNSVLTCSVACVYGPMLAASEERTSRLLPLLLASPASRAAIFLGRAVPFAVNGLLVACGALLVGSLAFDVDLPAERVPALILVILLASLACCGLGAALGAAGLLGRDVPFLSNLVTGVMLLVSGANVALERLPVGLRLVGDVLPLTRGIEAARATAAGAPFDRVAGLVAAELAIGTAYLLLALVLYAWAERRARRAGTLDLV